MKPSSWLGERYSSNGNDLSAGARFRDEIPHGIPPIFQKKGPLVGANPQFCRLYDRGTDRNEGDLMLDDHLTPGDFFRFIDRGLEGCTNCPLERHLTNCPECLETLDMCLLAEVQSDRAEEFRGRAGVGTSLASHGCREGKPSWLSDLGGIAPTYEVFIKQLRCNWNLTVHYGAYLFILLFFFQSSFFLGTSLGLFLLFPFAFIFTSLITHICFSLIESECYCRLFGTAIDYKRLFV